MPNFKILCNGIFLLALIGSVAFGKAEDSDEAVSCSADHFLCNDKAECTSEFYVCDGDFDCKDESDERAEICKANCTEDRLKSQFQCKAATGCISIRLVCNGENNCEDGSDEDTDLCSNCAGYEQLAKCPTGSKCILKEWFCDGDRDCSKADIFEEDPAICGDNCGGLEDRFQCGDKTCINIEEVCNGVSHCQDDSDESPELCATCNGDEGKVNCKGSTKCILKSFVCDGDQDCDSGSDEENCPAAEEEERK